MHNPETYGSDTPQMGHIGWTTTSSGGASGGFVTANSEAEILRARIRELETERDALRAAISEREDLEYFQANLYTSLAKRDHLRDVVVGPHDVLVVHVKTTDVPVDRIAVYLDGVKRDLKSFWSKLGFEDRILYVSGGVSGFSSIRRPEGPRNSIVM